MTIKPIPVPAELREDDQLEWLVKDGSALRAGDLVARAASRTRRKGRSIEIVSPFSGTLISPSTRRYKYQTLKEIIETQRVVQKARILAKIRIRGVQHYQYDNSYEGNFMAKPIPPAEQDAYFRRLASFLRPEFEKLATEINDVKTNMATKDDIAALRKDLKLPPKPSK